MLKTGEHYRNLGVDYFAQRDPERGARRAIRKLRALGYEVEAKKACLTRRFLTSPCAHGSSQRVPPGLVHVS